VDDMVLQSTKVYHFCLIEFLRANQELQLLLMRNEHLSESEEYISGFDVGRKERNEKAGGGDCKMEVCASELYTGQNKIPIVSCYRQHA
jgi:hypothetical protein